MTATESSAAETEGRAVAPEGEAGSTSAEPAGSGAIGAGILPDGAGPKATAAIAAARPHAQHSLTVGSLPPFRLDNAPDEALLTPA